MLSARTWLRTIGLGLCVWLGGTAAVRAHFLWLSARASETGDRFALAWFGEEPGPGEAHLVGRLEGLAGWLRAPGAEPQPLAWKLAPGAEPQEYQAQLPDGESWVLEAHRRYGVFRRGESPPILLEYYGKHLGRVASEHWAELARSPKLPLDVVPSWQAEELAVEVLWQGQPVAGAEVVIRAPDGSETTLTSDDRGQVRHSATAAGTWALRARHVEAERAGELDGQKYTAVWHIATATLARPLPDASAAAGEQATAADLLAGARAQRALWTEFPGFDCEARVAIDDASASGRCRVEADGTVELEVPEIPHRKWIDEQLASLINHRLPDAPFSTGAVFEPEPGTHVLGRLLRLEDAAMGSVYRVSENVITEVNREAGPLRFTISVLRVERNPEGKYLPGVFTVSFWNRESGALAMSQTFVHEWQRVGDYDLPARLQIVHSGAGERRVLDLRFSEPRLKEPAALPADQASADGRR